MFKNIVKKVSAVLCAVAVASQVAIPMVSAQKLANPAQYNAVNIAGANKTWSMTSATTAKNGNDFTRPNTTGYNISLDLTLNTLLKTDDTTGDIGRGRNAFALEVSSSGVEGGSWQANAPTTVDGTDAMSFRWKTTSYSNAGTLKVGVKYNITFAVKGTIDLTIVDTTGATATQTFTGLGMRNSSVATANLLYVRTIAAVEGVEESVTIENAKVYVPGPDELVATINGTEPAAAGKTIDLAKDKTEEFTVATSAKLAGAAFAGANLKSTLKMADGSALPKQITYANGKITTDVALEGGLPASPRTYETVLTVELYEKVDSVSPIRTVSYPITFSKVKSTAQEIVTGMDTTVRNSDGSATDIANIIDDVVLNKGNSMVKVEWASDNAAVLSTNGVVMPAVEDTVVKLTATVSAINGVKVYTQAEYDAKDAAEKAAIDTELANGEAAITRVVETTVTVKGNGAKNDAALAAITTFTSADTASKTIDPAAVIEDFKLPTTSSASKYITISWTSSSTALVVDTKTSTAQIFPKTTAAYDLNLVATATYKKNGEVLGTVTKTYPMTVKLTAATAVAKYAVRCDEIAPSNFTDVASYVGGSDVTSNIELKTKGIFGSSISWSSSQPTVISTSGKYTAPSSSKTVTLTATISSGKTAVEKKFAVTTGAKKSSNTGGTGTGTTTYIYEPVSTATPAPVINEPTTNSFIDLDSVEWAKEAITSLFVKGIVNGKTENTFEPNSDITRAEFAKIVMKAFGLEDATATVDKFSDVAIGDWYYTSVASAYKLGIINGYEDGTFGATDKITRQDMAVIINKAAKAANKTLTAVNAEIAFTDEADIADYAKESVKELQKAGVINGVSATEFAPRATATRAQAAKMVYEVIK